MGHNRLMPRRHRTLGVSAAMACALALVVSASANADPRDQKNRVDRKIEALKDQLDETSSDLKAAVTALQRTQSQLPGAQARLTQAQTHEVAASQYHDAMVSALDVARANEARAVDELARTTSQISDTRTRVARFAAQLYQGQGVGELSVALDASSADDFASRIAMADTAMAVQNQSLGRLAASQASEKAQRSHLTALSQDVARAESQAEAALQEATSARAAAATAKTQLDTLAARQTAETRTVAARKLSEQQRLAAMQVESNRLGAILRARALAAKAAAAKREAAARAAAKRAHRAYVAPSDPGGGYLSPPSNAYISSEFGMRYHPVLHYWRLHAGRDYAGACGSPIRAAAPGVIVSAGWGGGYGNRIVIDHGIHRGVDLTTTYNHLSRYAVRSGNVARGQVIGYIGTTGLSTGCHLHFETRQDGAPKDPRLWL